MAVEWSEAPQTVLSIANRIIDKYHPDLREARIAFVMRSTASKSGGNITYGKAKKVSEELQLHIEYDFIIWLANDWWITFSPTQKEALIDHQLSHCQWDTDDKSASMVGHDVEEFAHIIKRYGFWWPFSDAVEMAMQQRLPLPDDKPKQQGSVGTINFDKITTNAVQQMRSEGLDVEFQPAPARGQ